VFTNSTILVTGGTGSWGIELIRQLISLSPRKIIVLSRNENSQVLMRRICDDEKLHFCIGDIRDREAISKACNGVDYVFHLAALKHVSICEENPLEAIKTNVIGTRNVIEASIENRVKKVIYVSTDKAADPANTYGLTKALGEKLITHANEMNSVTSFLCVRGGNVLGSSGSVLPLFMKQIAENNQIIITDKRMTRYFVTPQHAIKVLLQAAELGTGGEVFVMHMDACKILDLAEVLIEHSGKKDINIIEIGARQGEKIHEVLIAKNEEQMSSVYNENLIRISPNTSITKEFPLPSVLTDSKQKLMTKKEIKELLTHGGFLN
jgi:UDP-N-acetylglucosamine 4,6-dehydratase